LFLLPAQRSEQQQIIDACAALALSHARARSLAARAGGGMFASEKIRKIP